MRLKNTEPFSELKRVNAAHLAVRKPHTTLETPCNPGTVSAETNETDITGTPWMAGDLMDNRNDS